MNITPDSFSDGGDFFDPQKALEHAMGMVEEGAEIIDVGGESTRPGAKQVSLDEELRRVIPIIETLALTLPATISIDTSKPEVMRQALSMGAGMINDINALQADGALEVAADADVPICLMHMQGTPRSMQESPCYDDVVGEVLDFLRRRVDECIRVGIARERLIIDPGFGFGKTHDHNLLLLNQLQRFAAEGMPVLVGLSRKSLIGGLTGAPVGSRLPGSLALAVCALERGASILRVHDVRATVEAVKVVEAVLSAEPS